MVQNWKLERQKIDGIIASTNLNVSARTNWSNTGKQINTQNRLRVHCLWKTCQVITRVLMVRQTEQVDAFSIVSLSNTLQECSGIDWLPIVYCNRISDFLYYLIMAHTLFLPQSRPNFVDKLSTILSYKSKGLTRNRILTSKYSTSYKLENIQLVSFSKC